MNNLFPLCPHCQFDLTLTRPQAAFFYARCPRCNGFVRVPVRAWASSPSGLVLVLLLRLYARLLYLVVRVLFWRVYG